MIALCLVFFIASRLQSCTGMMQYSTQSIKGGVAHFFTCAQATPLEDHEGVWLIGLLTYIIRHAYNDKIMARRYVALQNDPDLAPFIMEGRPTGRQLGGGSYGSVEEVGP